MLRRENFIPFQIKYIVSTFSLKRGLFYENIKINKIFVIKY